MYLVLLTVLLLGFGSVRTVSTPSISMQQSNVSSFLPRECQEIVNNSPGDDRFENTSVARSMGTFCPVVDLFVRCLENNQGTLRNSSVAIYRILGENFNSVSLKSRMNAVCGSIQNIADDLECFKNISEIVRCGSAVYSTDRAVTISNLCSAASSQETCIRELASEKCTATAVDFYASYSSVFVPHQCHTINVNPTPFPGGGSTDINVSIALVCAREAYPQLLMVVSGMIENRNIRPNDLVKVVLDSFEDICSNRSVFLACIGKKFIPPYSSPFDVIFDSLFNQKSIGPSLDQYCALTLSSHEAHCLENSAVGMFICGNKLKRVISTSLSAGHMVPIKTTIIPGISFMPTLPPVGTFTVTPGVGNVNPSEELICSRINEMNHCVGIQLRGCSPTLGQTFSNVNKLLYSKECQTAQPTLQMKNSPLGSVFVMCGYPLAGEVIRQFMNLNGSESKEDIFKIMQNLIPITCGYVDIYTKCIAEELPRSMNTFDRIVMKLFDFTDARRIQTVLKVVCDQTQVIQENIKCMADLFGSDYAQCVGKLEYKPMFERFENISYIDFDTITDLCSPIKEIGKCSANLMTHCSQILATTGRDAIFELLHTECGGERPWTSG